MVYQRVGGEVFNTCVKKLAVNGRLIVIELIKSYQDSSYSACPTLPILLSKWASIRGFFLNHYITEIPSHLSRLAQLYEAGTLKAQVDLGESVAGGPFRGLESGVCV